MLTVEPEGESPTEAFDIYKKRALKFLNTGFPDEIKEYNAYDTGIFLCSPVLFHAIEDSFLSTGDGTLSGGIRILSGKGNAKTFDIQDSYWIVTTQEVI